MLLNIEAELAVALAIMSMHDWDIELSTEVEEGYEDCHGAMDAVPEQKRGKLFIHPDIEEKDLKSTIRHELFHAILWEFSSAAHLMAKTDAEREWLRVAEERAVAHLEDMAIFK